MSAETRKDLAARLWNLCHVLRDDGIVYHKYLSELTYLIFLKNAKQLGLEKEFPQGAGWDQLLSARGVGMLGTYRKMLTSLGEDATDQNVRNIFAFPTTVFTHDENLRKVVDGIEVIDWHDLNRDDLGDIYESLLERNATEARSGSGQYFTPRPLVNAMVRVARPLAGETILDPAVGTGGFLIAAHRNSDELSRTGRLYEGIEIERDTFRLCLMNFYLHGMNGKIIHGDALTSDSTELYSADLVLANPPFGVSSGGARPRRGDLSYPTANKQLAFLQCIFLEIAPGGRAAVVVPDNVLNEPGVGLQLRTDLIDHFDLHTILRLPKGIFYAPGVSTNVLFFNRLREGESPSENVWFYDLRSDMPSFTKRNLIQDEHFDEFVAAFGEDPYGRSARAASLRFKSVSKEEIRSRTFDLDVRWFEDPQEDLRPDLVDLLTQMDTAISEAHDAMLQIREVVAEQNIDGIETDRKILRAEETS